MDQDLKRLFEQLMGTETTAQAECSVALDVLETPQGLEIVVDVVGVERDALQVVVARDTLLVAGHTRAAACEHHGHATFHIAERVFGRFARTVRLTGAFDIGRADATLRAGELRVRLPRIEDRRGREHRIPVQAD
jgi:HSP20 family protein